MLQQLAGVAMGLFNGENDRRQLRQQEKLNVMNNEHAKQMGLFNYDQQKRMWDETNYSAQMEHLKKAGLNPALLYGMSGGGGVTTGSHNASGSGSQKAERTDQIGMGLQQGAALAMTAAQTKVLESQADLNKAQADKTRGVDTQVGEATVQSLAQGVATGKAQEGLLKADTYLRELQGVFEGESMDDRLLDVGYKARQAGALLRSSLAQANVDEATQNEKIKLYEQQVLGGMINNMLGLKQGQKIDAEIDKLKADVAQGWERLRLEGKKVNIEAFKALVQEKLVNFQTSHPTITQVAGGVAQSIKDGATGIIKNPSLNGPGLETIFKALTAWFKTQ